MAYRKISTMATSWGELLERSGQDTTSSDLDSFLTGPDEPPSLSATQVDSALGAIHTSHDHESEDADFSVYSALSKTRWSRSDSHLMSGEQLDADDQDSQVVSVDLNLRKSDRERRVKRSYSPDLHENSLIKRGRRIKRTPQKIPPVPPGDRLANGRPFYCDICRSPYVCSMSKRKKNSKPSKYRPAPRHKVDPVSGHTLTLCNACGLAFERKSKPPKAKPVILPEDKERYLEEARTFALSLVESLNDPEAERLSCPHFKIKGCGCLQAFIVADGNVEVSRKRALMLLQLLKEAKRLSHQKWYDPRRIVGKNKKSRIIGLGNGQKRSKEFEQFVLTNRQTLRENLKLCERATQRVLMYSNNFLHKRLKTESRACRVERVKGKSALGQLIDVEKLTSENCCEENCVTMALTHARLLRQWRERVSQGQFEARRVLGEMLTPSGGQRSNCYRFISWVTGCSFSTISKVNEQMRRSGGDREPPVHGMCKYWQKKPKKSANQKKKEQENEDQEIVEDGNEQETAAAAVELVLDGATPPNDIVEQTAVSEDTAATIVLQHLPQPEGVGSVTDLPPMVMTNTTLPNIPFDLQTPEVKIAVLRQQLDQQQAQLQQQQQVLNQQLLHQILLDQATGGTGVQTQTLQNLQQLLNLQAQYQQQQQQQINNVQQQVLVNQDPIPSTATNTGQIIQIENLDQLQLQPCTQQTPLLLQQGPLQNVSQPDPLQQDDSLMADKPLDTATDLGNSQLKLDKVTIATSNANLLTLSTSGVNSLTLPQTVDNTAKSTTAGGAQPPVVQQILDLSQLGLGLGNQVNSLNLGTLPTNLLSQLSEYTITPNVNITLVQPQQQTVCMTTTAATTTSAAALATESSSTELMTEQALGQLLGSLNYTVLAFEPHAGLDGTIGDGTVPESTVAMVTTQTTDLLGAGSDSVDPTRQDDVGVEMVEDAQDSGMGTVPTSDQELSTDDVLKLLGHDDISGHKSS